MYKHIYIYIQNFIHKHTYVTHIHTHTLLSSTHISVQFLFCRCLSFFQLRTVMKICWEQPVILGFLTCLEQSRRLFKEPKRWKQQIDVCTQIHGCTHLFTPRKFARVTWKQHNKQLQVQSSWHGNYLATLEFMHNSTHTYLVHNITAPGKGLCRKAQTVVGKTSPPDLSLLYLIGRCLL